MGRRLFGALVFLALALTLFEHSFRLASDSRDGWGHFLLTGFVMSMLALNIWNGEISMTRCPSCQKPHTANFLE